MNEKRLTDEQREKLETELLRAMKTAAKRVLKGKVIEKKKDRAALFCAVAGTSDAIYFIEIIGAIQ